MSSRSSSDAQASETDGLWPGPPGGWMSMSTVSAQDGSGPVPSQGMGTSTPAAAPAAPHEPPARTEARPSARRRWPRRIALAVGLLGLIGLALDFLPPMVRTALNTVST